MLDLSELLILLRSLTSPNKHKSANLCLWYFPEVRRLVLVMNMIHGGGGESLKTTGLGKWLLFSAIYCSAHESGLLHYSGKLPACVLGASLHGGYEILNKAYSIWKILVFYMNIRQKSFSNFSLSIFRAYILIISCDVMRNKRDRDTFPCCLENIFELVTDQLSLLFCPLAAILDFTNALSPFYINHQVNVAAKISLHCTSAKKENRYIDKLGVFL